MPNARLLEAAGVVLLALAAVLSIRAMAPPAAVADLAPPEAFSAHRAARHILAISKKPHPAGSPAAEEVRDHVASALRELGLEPHLQAVDASTRTAGRVSSGRLVNVTARLKGSGGGGKAVMLAGHYDSVPQSFGAADDGSAVGTLLETARALKALPQLKRDVVFLFTDGEELTLLGAQGFVEEHPWRNDVGLVVNFDARGTSGTATMFETTDHVAGLVEVLAASPRPSASSAVTALAKAIPNGTDLTAFRHAGYVGLGFAFAEGYADYHTAWDNFPNLDLRSVQDEGDQALALVRSYGMAEGEIAEKRDVVYFDLLRRVLVRYPLSLAWAFAFVTLGALGWALARMRKAGLTLKSVAAGFGLLLLALLLGGGLTWLVTWAAAAAFPVELVLRQVVYRALQAFSVAVAVLCFTLALFKPSRTGVVAAGLVFWALLLVALLPSASFPVQWPLLFVSLALLASRRWALHVAAAASLVVLAPLGYSLHVAAGNGAPFVTAVFGVLVGMLLLPLISQASRRALAISGFGLLAVSVLAIPVSRLAVGASPRADYFSHATDADSGAAQWLAGARPLEGSLAAKQISADAKAELLDLDPAFALHRSAMAPAAAKPAPAIELRELPERTPKRRAELVVRSQARCVHLWQESGEALATVSVNGKAVPDLVRFDPRLDTRLLRLLTADRSPNSWKLKHCGPVGAELRVVVEASGDAKVPVRLVEAFDGLPAEAGQRGEGLVPATSGDLCLVGRRLRI